MSTDYREKEREFLDALKDDTGRDLKEWMAVIGAQNLPHRNDIIDWLRQQGFMFSKASWLERVFHNGGKPIYSDAVLPRRAMPKREKAVEAAPHTATSAASAPAPEPVQAVAPAQATEPDALDILLASAKAYRPLAQHLLREIAKSVPGSSALPAAGVVSLVRDGYEFAILVPGPKELRLGLSLNSQPFEAPLAPAKFPNPAVRVAAAITHMAVFNDVRQIDSVLLGWIVKASERTAAAA